MALLRQVAFSKQILLPQKRKTLWKWQLFDNDNNGRRERAKFFYNNQCAKKRCNLDKAKAPLFLKISMHEGKFQKILQTHYFWHYFFHLLRPLCNINAISSLVIKLISSLKRRGIQRNHLKNTTQFCYIHKIVTYFPS